MLSGEKKREGGDEGWKGRGWNWWSKITSSHLSLVPDILGRLVKTNVTGEPEQQEEGKAYLEIVSCSWP